MKVSAAELITQVLERCSCLAGRGRGNELEEGKTDGKKINDKVLQ